MDDQGSDANRPRTVYVKASNPAIAMVDSPVNRWIDVVCVGGPFAAAFAFVMLGYGRSEVANADNADGWQRIPMGTSAQV